MPPKGGKTIHMQAAFSNSSILTLNYAFSTTNSRDKNGFHWLSSSKKIFQRFPDLLKYLLSLLGFCFLRFSLFGYPEFVRRMKISFLFFFWLFLQRNNDKLQMWEWKKCVFFNFSTFLLKGLNGNGATIVLL